MLKVISESVDDTKYNWFMCDEYLKSVSVLPEEECEDIVTEVIRKVLVDEGIIDEDDESYDYDKLHQEFRDNIAEAKYGLTKHGKGLKIEKGKYIIMRSSEYKGKLPLGYSVNKDGNLISSGGKVVGIVEHPSKSSYRNGPTEGTCTFKMWQPEKHDLPSTNKFMDRCDLYIKRQHLDAHVTSVKINSSKNEIIATYVIDDFTHTRPEEVELAIHDGLDEVYDGCMIKSNSYVYRRY